MTVSLAKGGSVSLTRLAPALSSVTVGIGWALDGSPGSRVDIDASALVCDPNGRVLSDAYFVFFNNLVSPGGAVEHAGDRPAGEGKDESAEGGDNAHIDVDLAALPPDAEKVVFLASVYDAERRHHSLRQVAAAFIRVLDRGDGAELARYDLTDRAGAETAIILGELYRSGAEWKFRAVGRGYRTGLAGIVSDYGVEVG